MDELIAKRESASRRWQPGAAVWGSVGIHAAALGAVAVQPALWPLALGAVAANHVGLTAIGLWPRSTLLGRNLLRLNEEDTAQGFVGLSFDDGPHPEHTPWVLDQLDAAQMKATFFVVGERVKQHPALVREIHQRGHRVENHSTTHSKAFSTFGMGRLAREIEQTQALIAEQTGVAPRLFRAPAGLRSPLLEPVLARYGLTLASWTRRGFDTVERDSEVITQRLLHRLAAGDILLMHDGNCAVDEMGQPVIVDVLPKVLDALKTKGLVGAAIRQ
jgi:peptidoglycan-N-acetylglucosamine deacetylase